MHVGDKAHSGITFDKDLTLKNSNVILNTGLSEQNDVKKPCHDVKKPRHDVKKPRHNAKNCCHDITKSCHDKLSPSCNALS